jgi:hypothetical protein
VALMLPVFLGFMALAIDMGRILQVRASLQGIADASALAAAQELPSDANARMVAQQYATQNDPNHGTLVAAADVAVGHWDGFGVFTPAGAPINAVRVITHRTAARGNAVPLFFARVLGFSLSDVAAAATATSGGGGGTEDVTRFIIDADDLFKEEAELQLEEMGKSSVPEKSKDWFITDNNDDWFIDLPTGTKMEVPTGTQSDPAMWDLGHAAFPFYDTSDPSFQDFLNFQDKTDSWRYSLLPLDMLKELPGVNEISHPEVYPQFVSPGKCQVSPLNKSDVNDLNDEDNVPMANASGERLGLMAFSIDSLGRYPNGDGNKLPHLWITVCDPTPFIGEGGLVVLPFAANLPLRLVQ